MQDINAQAGRAQSCVSAEQGTFVFAVLNLIVVTLGSVCSVVYFIYCTIYIKEMVSDMGNFQGPNGGIGYGLMLIYGVCVTILMTFSFIALTFAVLLIYGVIKKKSGFIKAYFVFGCVVSVLSTLSVFGYIHLTNMTDFLTPSVAFVGCLIYWIVLTMIHITAKTFETASIQFNHQPLEDTKY